MVLVYAVKSLVVLVYSVKSLVVLVYALKSLVVLVYAVKSGGLGLCCEVLWSWSMLWSLVVLVYAVKPAGLGLCCETCWSWSMPWSLVVLVYAVKPDGLGLCCGQCCEKLGDLGRKSSATFQHTMCFWWEFGVFKTSWHCKLVSSLLERQRHLQPQHSWGEASMMSDMQIFIKRRRLSVCVLRTPCNSLQHPSSSYCCSWLRLRSPKTVSYQATSFGAQMTVKLSSHR